MTPDKARAILDGCNATVKEAFLVLAEEYAGAAYRAGQLNPYERTNDMAQLTQAHKDVLRAAGIDATKVDWSKVVQLFAALIALIFGGGPTPTPPA